LVCPGVAGRADRDAGGAVGVREVECILYPHRPVVARRGLRHLDAAGPAVELGPVAPRRVAPFARTIWHEPDPVDAVTVIETGHLERAIAPGEAGGQLDLGERVAARRPAQDDLGHPPLLDGRLGPTDAG